MKTSDLFVRALENEGVQYIFGVPGEENIDFLESLRLSSIKLIVTRHEQSAGFMAATIGRLTGKPGVCLSTLGPGATNFMTAAAYAQLGAMPMMMITGQKPIHKSKQGRFQIINVVEMMRPVTKFTTQIQNGALLSGVVREAFRQSMQERPGAVHIELPEDIAAEEVYERIFPVNDVRRPIAEYKAIARAVEKIYAAKRPLLCIGSGSNRKQTAKMLRAFVDKTGIPFFTTQMGKGVIDERHEKYLGCAAFSYGDIPHCAAEHADLIINVGHDVVEKPPFIMREDGPEVIHINFSPANIDNVYFPQLEVVGDIANAIWQLNELIDASKAHWNFDEFDRLRTILQNELKEEISNGSFPLYPQRIVNDIRTVMPDGGIVALDNGMYKLWFARQYTTHQPNTLLLDNALATMGAGLPSAMAAKLVYPDRAVVAVCGDGGFMINSQELETAVRLGLHLVVVIINDSGYGMIKWKQEAMGLENFGLDFTNPDFVKYAEAYGAVGHRLNKGDDLKDILRLCLTTPAVHVIDVPVNYGENLRVMTKKIQSNKC